MKSPAKKAILLASVVSLIGGASAQAGTWNGTNTNWSDAGNWDALPSATVNATFGPTATPIQPIVTGAVDALALVFSTPTGGWTLGGAGSINLGGNINATSQTSGTSTLNVGTLKLTGVGLWRVGNSSSNTDHTTLTINSAVDLNGNNLTIAPIGAGSTKTGTINLTNTISGNGNIAIGNANTQGSTSLATITGSNTYSGNLTITRATLSVNSINAIGGADSTGVITMGTAGQGFNSSLTFTGTGGAITTGRQVQFVGYHTNGTQTLILKNDDSNASNSLNFTYSGDVVTATGTTGTNINTKIQFGGVNAGDNRFAGAIDNVLNGTTQLEKVDAGKWTLGGANTYTGNTTVSAGTLTLADNAGLAFVIGASGVNNSISGSGALNLNGDFTFNLAGAATTLDTTWQIVSNSTLSEIYDSTFTVVDFTNNNDDTWSKMANGVTYTFNESSGALSVTAVPEPASTVALFGGMGVLLGMRRRSRKA